MKEPQQSLEEALFELVVQKPTADERAAFLDGVCRDNPALRSRLDALLEGHFGGTGFLKATESEVKAVPAPQSVESPAQMIGRYKLLEKIGEGGFGEVWMADQREPVKRRVALKIIKLGMDSKQVVARFEAERQALALMDHPNIAKVFDAGATDAGRPYFVMELVRGIKITDYCDQNQLPTQERLKLFAPVCHAIQHAHQKGIIHRDIKPSNILVTLHDGVPVPKVIDFGIAKATQQELTDKTVFTQFQQFIGTPAYISPEQAEMSGLDIDTRSDIYSLGVLLYELLVGQTPFDAREMLKGGIDALRQIIREREPLRPSTRLNTLPGDARTTVGKRRQTDAGKLVHQLRGDLDWIVMKCLEKDRTRRYDTANGLAMDIQRHLANEPVVARQPSAAYRFHKLVRRNKLTFAAGVAVALALVVGISVSTWQAVEATKARKVADSSRQQAQAEQKIAETARANEATQRRLAEARAYAADMNLAQQALAADNLGLATELLDRHRPQPGQPDRRGWEWRYLWQQSRSDALYTLCRQSDPVRALTVSHDGKWLAIEAHGISVWNLQSRREVMRVNNPGALAFSPVTPVLAMWDAESGSPELRHRLRYWDAQTEQVAAVPPSADLMGPLYLRDLAFTPDGQSVVTAFPGWGNGIRNELVTWGTSDGKKRASYPIRLRGPGVGLPASMSRGTNLIALAESDRRLRVIDVNTGAVIFNTQVAGKGWLETVALSADGSVVASSLSPDESTIRLWDVASGRERGVLEGHSAFVQALVLWPDGKTLASAGADQTIRIWDVEKRLLLATLRGQGAEIHRLALLPDNSTLISGGKDGTVMVWDTTASQRKKNITTLPCPVHGFWIPASGGDSILTIEEGWLTRWGGSDFQEKEPLFQVNSDQNGACLSTDQRMLATGTATGAIALWDVPGRKLLREVKIASGPISPRKFLGDTSLAIWIESEKSVAIHDVVTGRRISSWPDAKPASKPRFVSPDGRWCLTGGGDEPGLLRELATGREIGSAPVGGPGQAAFSADGKQLAIPFDSGIVRLWDLPALTETRVPFKGVLRGVHSVAFSPDGRRLAVGSVANESLKVWDLESGLSLLTLPGEGGPCWATAFSPEGNTLATRHELGTLDIWRVPTWEEIAAAEANDKMKIAP